MSIIMKKIMTYIALVCLVIGMLCYWSFFTSDQPKSRDRIAVVCTTGMIADAVKEIGGEYVDVHNLMGPGVDPHLYRARASDVQALQDADIIFYNGLHLEGKMSDLFAQMSRYKHTVAMAQNIAPDRFRASEFDELYDPHIWFDVALWADASASIRDALMQEDPEHAVYYEARYDTYKKDLLELDTYVRNAIEQVPKQQRILITAHDAFGYFGKAYGVDVVGLQGISTDAQIGTRDVIELAAFIVANNVPALFVEASIPRRNIEAVQRAVQARNTSVAIGPELYSDTLGEPGTAAASYIGMVGYNVDAITRALTADKGEV
jgi:manganese/zinc/iron transport system substrate-binding protein